MSANIRGVFAIVFVVFLLGQPDTGEAKVPAEEAAVLTAAIEDLKTTFGNGYPDGDKYLKKLRDIEQHRPELIVR